MVKAQYGDAGQLACQWPKWVTDGPPAVGGKCSLSKSFNFPPGAEQKVDFVLVGTTTRAPTTTPEPTSESTAYETDTIRAVPRTTPTPKAGGLKTWEVVVIVVAIIIIICFVLAGFLVLWKCGTLNRILCPKGTEKELGPTEPKGTEEELGPTEPEGTEEELGPAEPKGAEKERDPIEPKGSVEHPEPNRNEVTNPKPLKSILYKPKEVKIADGFTEFSITLNDSLRDSPPLPPLDVKLAEEELAELHDELHPESSDRNPSDSLSGSLAGPPSDTPGGSSPDPPRGSSPGPHGAPPGPSGGHPPDTASGSPAGTGSFPGTPVANP